MIFINVSLPLFSSPSFPSMRVNVPAKPWWTVETFGTLTSSMSHPKSQRERLFSNTYMPLCLNWNTIYRYRSPHEWPHSCGDVWFLHNSLTLDISYLPWFHNVLCLHCSLSNLHTVYIHLITILPPFTPDHAYRGCKISLIWQNLFSLFTYLLLNLYRNIYFFLLFYFQPNPASVVLDICLTFLLFPERVIALCSSTH